MYKTIFSTLFFVLVVIGASQAFTERTRDDVPFPVYLVNHTKASGITMAPNGSFVEICKPIALVKQATVLVWLDNPTGRMRASVICDENIVVHLSKRVEYYINCQGSPRISAVRYCANRTCTCNALALPDGFTCPPALNLDASWLSHVKFEGKVLNWRNLPVVLKWSVNRTDAPVQDFLYALPTAVVGIEAAVASDQSIQATTIFGQWNAHWTPSDSDLAVPPECKPQHPKHESTAVQFPYDILSSLLGSKLSKHRR